MQKYLVSLFCLFLVGCGTTTSAPVLDELVEPAANTEPALTEDLESDTTDAVEEDAEPEEGSNELFTLHTKIQNSFKSVCTQDFSLEELPQVFQDYLGENEGEPFAYCVYQNKAYLGIIITPDGSPEWQILYRQNSNTVVASDSQIINGYGDYLIGFGILPEWDVYVLDQIGDANGNLWAVYALDNDTLSAEVIQSCGASWDLKDIEDSEEPFVPEYECSVTYE